MSQQQQSSRAAESAATDCSSSRWAYLCVHAYIFLSCMHHSLAGGTAQSPTAQHVANQHAPCAQAHSCRHRCRHSCRHRCRHCCRHCCRRRRRTPPATALKAARYPQQAVRAVAGTHAWPNPRPLRGSAGAAWTRRLGAGKHGGPGLVLFGLLKGYGWRYGEHGIGDCGPHEHGRRGAGQHRGLGQGMLAPKGFVQRYVLRMGCELGVCWLLRLEQPVHGQGLACF